MVALLLRKKIREMKMLWITVSFLIDIKCMMTYSEQLLMLAFLSLQVVSQVPELVESSMCVVVQYGENISLDDTWLQKVRLVLGKMTKNWGKVIEAVDARPSVFVSILSNHDTRSLALLLAVFHLYALNLIVTHFLYNTIISIYI